MAHAGREQVSRRSRFSSGQWQAVIRAACFVSSVWYAPPGGEQDRRDRRGPQRGREW
ncbi:MAG: hypothetical protein L0I24_11540 [Pseudonocardia sp.]|nr:hypothetical protein [Pseudonocardia sp.]